MSSKKGRRLRILLGLLRRHCESKNGCLTCHSLYLKVERNMFKTRILPRSTSAGLRQARPTRSSRGPNSRPKTEEGLPGQEEQHWKTKEQETKTMKPLFPVHIVPRRCLADWSHDQSLAQNNPLSHTKKKKKREKKAHQREEHIEVTRLSPEVISLPPLEVWVILYRRQHQQMFTEAIEALELELSIKSRVVGRWE